MQHRNEKHQTAHRPLEPYPSKVAYHHPISGKEDVLARYNASGIDLEAFENANQHVEQICRCLAQPTGKAPDHLFLLNLELNRKRSWRRARTELDAKN